MRKISFIFLFLGFLMRSFEAQAALCDSPDIMERALCLHSSGKFAESFQLMRGEANKENKGAQLILSDMYFAGEGTDHDLSKAVYWAEKAFSAGARGAAKRLARLHSSSKSDSVKLIGWLAVSAKEGDPYSMMYLGDYFYENEAPKLRNSCLARFWYEQALITTDLVTTIDKIPQNLSTVIHDKFTKSKQKCGR